jgi:hypothetical protein
MPKWSRTKTNRERGKRHERAIAKKLGGLRIGVLSGEDVKHDTYSVECKSREKLAIEKWMLQCEANCPEDKIPLLVCHTHNQQYDNDLVVMRMRDWEMLNLFNGDNK